MTMKQKTTIMIALMTAMFFAAINQTLVSSAMPRIIATLGGMDYYSWVITIYMLTSTVASALVGKLSDLYGRKPFLIVGLIIFMVGSFLTGFSNTIFQMILFRSIQGLGAGILMSVTTMAVGDLFEPRERAKWTGIMMAIFGFAVIIGPSIGGILVDHMDWQWLFWLFLPLGVVALAMIWKLFPKLEKGNVKHIDYLGGVFLSLSIVSLLLGISFGGEKYPWDSIEIIGLFVSFLIFTIIFVFVEHKAKEPMLPLSLFKNGIVNISNISNLFINAGMMGIMIYLPFFVQGVKGISPTLSGFMNIPMSIMMILSSIVAGRMITKYGKYKQFAVIGILLMVIGALALSFVNSILLVLLCMAVFGTGLGMSMPVFTLTVQNAVPKEELGVATSTATLFRNLGSTIGIAVLGTVMSNSMKSHMTENMKESSLDLGQVASQSPELLDKFHNPQILLDPEQLETISSSLPEQMVSLFENMIQILRTSLDQSLTTTFVTVTVILAAAFLLILWLKEIPLRSEKEEK